jgi:hypothetical protein
MYRSSVRGMWIRVLICVVCIGWRLWDEPGRNVPVVCMTMALVKVLNVEAYW